MMINSKLNEAIEVLGVYMGMFMWAVMWGTLAWFGYKLLRLVLEVVFEENKVVGKKLKQKPRNFTKVRFGA